MVALISMLFLFYGICILIKQQRTNTPASSRQMRSCTHTLSITLTHTHTIVVSCHSNGRTWVHSIRKRFSFAAERKCYSGYMSAFCSVPPPSSVHSATMKFFSQMYSVRVLCVRGFFPVFFRCSLSVQHQMDRMRLCVERNRTYKCMTIPTMYRGIYEYTHAHWQYEKCTRNHFGRRFRQSWHFFSRSLHHSLREEFFFGVCL